GAVDEDLAVIEELRAALVVGVFLEKRVADDRLPRRVVDLDAFHEVHLVLDLLARDAARERQRAREGDFDVVRVEEGLRGALRRRRIRSAAARDRARQDGEAQRRDRAFESHLVPSEGPDSIAPRMPTRTARATADAVEAWATHLETERSASAHTL